MLYITYHIVMELCTYMFKNIYWVLNMFRELSNITFNLFNNHYESSRTMGGKGVIYSSGKLEK